MRFSVNTRELNEAVSVVTKAMPSNATLPILEGIYMYAANDTLFIKCTDLSLQIETEIPAIIDDEGSAVLPGKHNRFRKRREHNEHSLAQGQVFNTDSKCG